MKHFLLCRSLVAIDILLTLILPPMVSVTVAQDGPACSVYGYVTKAFASGSSPNFVTDVCAVAGQGVQSGETVYAAGIGLHVSYSGGITFETKTTANGLGDNSVYGVYAVGSTVYAATGGGLSISTDQGHTFTNRTTANGLGSNFVHGVYAVGSTVYAATGGGLSISTDGGNSFTTRTTANGLGSNDVYGVYAVGSTVYAATHGGGLSISTDGGNSFITKTEANGLGSNDVFDVYAVGSRVYAATLGGLSISTDGGNGFTNKTTANGLGDNSVNGVYAVGSTVYISTAGGVGISTDGGDSFTNRSEASYPGGGGPPRGVYVLGSKIYAAGNYGISIFSCSLKSLALDSFTATPSEIPLTGTTTLLATVSGGVLGPSGYYSYTFSGPGTFTSKTVNRATVAGLSAGVQTFTVTVTDATTPTSQTISGTVSVTVNPDLNLVNLSVSSHTASEASPTAITVTATASAPVVGDQTVDLSVTGTDLTTSDYALSGTTITIPNGQTAGSVTFTVLDDNDVEYTETAELTIRNPSPNIVLGSPTTQSITITDNEARLLPDLTVVLSGPASATVNQPYTYTLVVTNCGTATATDVAVQFTLPNDVTYNDATGGGFAGVQYSESGFYVLFTGGTITPGTSKTLTVTVTPTAVGAVTAQIDDAFVDPSNTIPESNEENNGSPTAVRTTVVRGRANPDKSRPVATTNDNQTATVGTHFAYTINAFTDAETPNGLTYQADIEPANGLVFDPHTRIISGTPTQEGVSRVQVKATDPGGLSARTSFSIRVKPAPETFAITGVTTVSCKSLSARQWEVSFTPQYTGLNGQPVSFSVVNELPPTTAGGPYTLHLNVGKPVITLKATQQSTARKATFSYEWLAACRSGGRLGAEPEPGLEVRILGNPAEQGRVSVEVRGAATQPLRLTLTDGRGQTIGSHTLERAGAVEEHTFEVSRQSAGGVLLLRATTPGQSQTVKVLKAD